MATLEKIRSKSVLLFVIIIVALLAFILGDFLTSGRTYFGTGTTVAKIGNAKVDYNEYQNRMNQAGEQARNQQIDNGVLSQQVIRDLLVEKMLEREYNDLGIVVTDNEIQAALTGDNIHPAAMQQIYMLSQYIGLPVPSGREVLMAIKNPAAHNLPPEAAEQLAQAWAAIEQNVEQELLREKFDRLLLGLFTANELDAQNLHNDVSTVRHLSYATQPLTAVEDSEAEITDADRRAAWEQNKGNYRLDEPVRSIDYIMVRIEPSQQDRAAGISAVEDALLALNTTEGTDALASDTRFVINHGTATRSQLRDNDLKAFLDTAKVGEAVQLKNIGDSYTLVKLLGVTNDIDSINISLLGRRDGGSVDSLRTLVENGATFASLSDDNVQGQDSIWASLATPEIPASIKSALTNKPVGEVFVVNDSTQGRVIETLYRINRRNAPVKVYEVAEISFVIDPSQETLAQLSGDLNTFVSNNSSAADFSANAAEAGYTILSGVVSASTPNVGNAADSRTAVKWLMKAKSGQVMPVFTDSKQTYMLTAAVKNIYDGDYLPWNADLIASQVDAQALRNKKAQVLIDRYAGKAQDLEGYAKLMGTSVHTGDAMFTAPMLATIGMGESTLQGIVAAAEQGKLVGPVQGNNGVVVFVVNGEDNQGRPYSFEDYAAQFARALNIGNPRLLQNNDYMRYLLMGSESEKNNSLEFIQGFGE